MRSYRYKLDITACITYEAAFLDSECDMKNQKRARESWYSRRSAGYAIHILPVSNTSKMFLPGPPFVLIIVPRIRRICENGPCIFFVPIVVHPGEYKGCRYLNRPSMPLTHLSRERHKHNGRRLQLPHPRPGGGGRWNFFFIDSVYLTPVSPRY